MPSLPLQAKLINQTQSPIMLESEKIFRSYFESEADCTAFYLKYKPEKSEIEGKGNGICTRPNKKAQAQSYEDKPAYIGVLKNGKVAIEVVWNDKNCLHRESGPAWIITYRSGRVVRYWYLNGKRIPKPK